MQRHEGALSLNLPKQEKQKAVLVLLQDAHYTSQTFKKKLN